MAQAARKDERGLETPAKAQAGRRRTSGLPIREFPISLTRNIGSSVGIAIVVALLAENTQTVHSRLVEHLREDNPLARMPHMMPPFSLTTPSGLAALNAEATRQAAMVAYIDDFKLMMMVVVVGLPLLLLLRKPRPVPTAAAAE